MQLLFQWRCQEQHSPAVVPEFVSRDIKEGERVSNKGNLLPAFGDS
jgi:hypothetical protein